MCPCIQCKTKKLHVASYGEGVTTPESRCTVAQLMWLFRLSLGFLFNNHVLWATCYHVYFCSAHIFHVRQKLIVTHDGGSLCVSMPSESSVILVPCFLLFMISPSFIPFHRREPPHAVCTCQYAFQCVHVCVCVYFHACKVQIKARLRENTNEMGGGAQITL